MSTVESRENEEQQKREQEQKEEQYEATEQLSFDVLSAEAGCVKKKRYKIIKIKKTENKK